MSSVYPWRSPQLSHKRFRKLISTWAELTAIRLWWEVERSLFICATVEKFLHRVASNFHSASSVLVCLGKTKTNASAVYTYTHIYKPHPALFSNTRPSRSPSNPYSWHVLVSITPSATCEGSLAQPSLNKWNQSKKRLAHARGMGGFGSAP